MRTTAALIAAGLALALAAPAAADPWSHRNSGYGHDRARSGWAPSAFDWRSQLDRPGDYRCDAFWDANRTDCGARWRDQRHRTTYGYANRGHGYDYGYSRASHGYGNWRRRGYGDAGYGYAAQGTAYHGAYGRPDIVYPSGGRRTWNGARDPNRIDWCRSAYRSYDPASGYYRAYSGRLIFCG